MEADILIRKFVDAFHQENFNRELDHHYEIEAFIKSNPESSQQFYIIKEYSHFLQEMRSINLFLGHLVDEDHWKIIRKTETILIASKTTESDFYVKCQASIQSSALYVFAILAEVDLLPS